MKISDKLTFITKISTILTVLTMFSVLTGGLSAFASNIFCRTSNYEGVTGFATAPNVDFGPYMKRMQDKIKSYWAPPAMDLNAQIVVKYRIMKNGSLDSYGISASSGSQELDNAAIEALKKAAPFEPLPEGFNKESILVQFTFDYQKPNNVATQQASPENNQIAQNSGRQIQTLAISPLGNAQASTVASNQNQGYRQPQQVVRSNANQQFTTLPVQPAQSRPVVVQPVQQNNSQQPLMLQQPTSINGISMQNPQKTYNQSQNLNNTVPVRTNSQAGTIAVGTPPAVRQQAGTTNTQERAIAYSQPVTKQPVVNNSTQQNFPTNVPTVIDNQLYTTAPALAEPTVNPRRTVDIDTFAEPEQLPLTIPLTPESEQISKPVLRTQTPMTSQEINRVALPVKYDPEIEKVVVDEDELPPIETPTLSTGVSKVAIPQRRQKVKQPVIVAAPPVQTPAPTYITAPPRTVYTQPQPPVVAPVKVPDLSAYMAKVQRKITRKWRPPLSDYSTKVVVNYIIKKNGDLGKYSITESSGNSRMDVSATEALKKAAPFPPLPSGYNEDTLEVKFTFDYNVYKNKSEKKGIEDLEDEDDEV